MHQNKDTQKEIIVFEAVVWLLWAFFFCTLYLFSNSDILN